MARREGVPDLASTVYTDYDARMSIARFRSCGGNDAGTRAGTRCRRLGARRRS